MLLSIARSALAGGQSCAGAGTEVSHAGTGMASKGSREGKKLAGRGLELFFSPLPALGRVFRG